MAQEPTTQSDFAKAAAHFDIASLGESIRAYTLAKQMGVPSRAVVEALKEIGLNKVAQSSLKKDEVLAILRPEKVEESQAQEDVQPKGQGADEEEKPKRRRATKKAAKKTSKKTAKKAVKKTTKRTEKVEEEPQAEPKPEAVAAETPAEEEEKPKRGRRKATRKAAPDSEEHLRERVRKNVANEIHQIEEKVDASLTKALEKNAAEEPELLQDVTPEITPVPQEEGEATQYAPVFVAPEKVEKTEARPKRRRSSRRSEPVQPHTTDEAEETVTEEVIEEPKAIKGSTRLEAQRRRRTEMREAGKKSPIVSQAEFLARRESVRRTMIVRERERHDHTGMVTQVGVLEDGLLTEHFVTSEAQASMIGNIYIGRVQNVLESMEAAFVDIGTGRNGVLYASDLDWKAFGSAGRSRKIEKVLRSGDPVLVQVSKDPIGHKGPRLTTQISLAGRYLVYVPGGRSAGISRKLPAPERKRLKDILTRVIPGQGGAIIRTAAENVPEEAIAADVSRLHTQWENITQTWRDAREDNSRAPGILYEEPDMLVKVIRDVFNEDFSSLLVDGKRAWNIVRSYVESVAPDLLDRLEKFNRNQHDGQDAFAVHRVDEQLTKALGRKVWLPSGGYLIIDHTEAMIVIDVNTGKFTGSGGNLEETVTRNNLEAAEEIVRQIRLRDLGGMIVVDFIDMVLPENQDLVLRRLKEALGRDRTRHQVSEVTSLGLVQMTRKRLGTGLLETFSTECAVCEGRGLILHDDPVTDSTPTDRHQASHTPKRDEELERLVDAVVRTEDDEEDSEAQKPSRSRRRGRRGGSRGRGKAHNEVSSVEEIAAQAVETAAQADPEEPSDDSYVPAGETTYEEAVEAFEASPRRRRATRGNSRSDHRPRREDFVEKPSSTTAVAATATSRKRRRAVRRGIDTAGAAGAVQQAPTTPVQRQRSGTKRRRATRRSSNS